MPSVEELLAQTEREINHAHARMELVDERTALQCVDDGKTTDHRAIDALSRPERFEGEHLVAKMWLQTSKTARIWSVYKK